MKVIPYRALRELPSEERPRERLLRQGAAALADAELLAVLLRTGRPGCSALDMARQILDEVGHVDRLISLDERSLRRRGLGQAKAATLLAAIELGRRLARGRMIERDLVDRPETVARYLVLRYAVCDQEVMGALYLDSRQRLLGERELFRGTLDRAAVEPRAIFKEALLRGAARLILFHTHPSGDPSPSSADVSFTRRIADAGDLLGIELVDHLILGESGRWTSLKRRGGW